MIPTILLPTLEEVLNESARGLCAEAGGPVLEVRIFDGQESEHDALDRVGVHVRSTVVHDGSAVTNAVVATVAMGVVLNRTLDAGTLDDRVGTLRALGKAVRRWCPEAADALESWDGVAR